MNQEFSTTHNLFFEARPWHSDGWVDFRVGTITGLYKCEGNSYCILAVLNRENGNGHFEDVLEWFEHSCRREAKTLKFLEVMNPDFKKHLIDKRGFKDIGGDNVEKVFE